MNMVSEVAFAGSSMPALPAALQRFSLSIALPSRRRAESPPRGKPPERRSSARGKDFQSIIVMENLLRTGAALCKHGAAPAGLGAGSAPSRRRLGETGRGDRALAALPGKSKTLISRVGDGKRASGAEAA